MAEYPEEINLLTLSSFQIMKVYATYHDGDLVTLLQNGDHSAFEEIYLRYWKPLYYSAFNLLKDEAVCQDIVQELFISIWQRRDSLQITTSLKGYLFTAVRYEVFKQVRKDVPDRLLMDIEKGISPWNGDSQLLLTEIEALIREAVEQLPPACKEIYNLSREEELSHAEIADKLDISTKTVANQMTKALRHIRTSLSQILPLLSFFIKI